MKKELLEHSKVLEKAIQDYVLPRVRAVENNNNAWKGLKEVKVLGPDAVRFQYNGQSIDITNLTPIKVTNEKFEEPVLMNKAVQDVAVDVVSNTGSQDATWGYSYSKEESYSDTTDVGASISVGIRQQIGYGGDLYGASGETELSLNVSASFNKSSTVEQSTTKEQTIEVTVPANKRCSISQEHSVAKYKQNVSCEAVFDFKLVIRWDRQWDYTFQDTDDLQDCLNNTAQQNQHDKKNKFIAFVGSTIEWDDVRDSIGGVLVKQTKRFDKATSGDIKITEA